MGMNDAPAHRRHLGRDGELCPYVAVHHAKCRLWWVTTHERLNTIHHPGHPIMTHAIVNDFNVGMREWFEAGHCGLTHVVDVYNMTGTPFSPHNSFRTSGCPAAQL